MESRTARPKQRGGRSWGLARRLRSPLQGRLRSKEVGVSNGKTDFCQVVLKLARNVSLTSLVVGLLREHLEVEEPGLQPGHHKRGDGQHVAKGILGQELRRDRKRHPDPHARSTFTTSITEVEAAF